MNKKKKPFNPFLATLIYFLIATLIFGISFPMFRRSIVSKNWPKVNATISNVSEFTYGVNAGVGGRSREDSYYEYDLSFKYNDTNYRFNDYVSDNLPKGRIQILVNPKNPEEILFQDNSNGLQIIMGIIISIILITGIIQLIDALKSNRKRK